MLKKISVFVILLFLIIVVIFINIKDSIIDIDFKNISNIESVIKNDVYSEIKKTISSPAPLISKSSSVNSYLTIPGVLKWTNIQRDETESLPPLLQNDLLDGIAMRRLDDMFSEQYFEHISPNGIGASDVAKSIGYEYISIGENIALGNFENDQTLVQAWMDSPGHRANILNGSYTELGVAVKKGTYNEQKTWIGVQIFARPISDCPSVNPQTKIEIEYIESEIETLQVLASTLRIEIENSKPRSNEGIKLHNKKIDRYNDLVKEINNLIKKQKLLIQDYNRQINVMNSCLIE